MFYPAATWTWCATPRAYAAQVRVACPCRAEHAHAPCCEFCAVRSPMGLPRSAPAGLPSTQSAQEARHAPRPPRAGQ
eukprot:12846057-Alexandrium_andersonii.AAC.1